jgi:hypothetical protein
MSGPVRAVATVALLAGLLAGCGIPDSTDVVSVARGPSTGLSSGDENAPTRTSRESTDDKAQFIANYLQAAAGDVAGATTRVKDFIAPAARRGFKPTQELRVVRLVEKPLVNPGSAKVSLKVQQVGVLSGTSGTLEPPVSVAGITSYDFDVDAVEGQSGLYVTKAPQLLLLSDTALNTFYERRTIYFWNREKTALVPDVRYLSSDIPSERRPTQIVKWLAAGPSPWLAGAVDELSENTKVLGNVPVTDNKLQVNLSGITVPPDDPRTLERLGRQLQWSLRPNPAPELELRFDNQVQGTFSGSDYLTSNPAYRFADRPERFVVYDGRIHRLAQSVNPDQPVPLVTNEVNRNVRSAALTSGAERSYAALVAGEGGRQVLRVGTAMTGQAPIFRRAVLPGAAGRPVWATTPSGADTSAAVGLIVVAGRIHSFGANAVTRLVDWQGGPARVTGVSVAPDGHRVAVVAGGRLYLSILTTAGNGMQLSPPRPIRVLLRDLTAVDWSSEGSVVVAGVVGATNRVAITDVSIDGAVQTDRQPDLGAERITHLVAYPANPATTTSGDANAVAYVADGVAYDVVTGPKRIGVADLAAPVPSPADGELPTAPFFLN